MAWADFNPKALTRDQFAARIAALNWSSWKPVGIVLHNTAAPTLAQWAESGPKHDARIKNLQSYYEGLGWHGGPHWFISRDWLNEFNNPLRRGTHSPSYNATHFGIEMVGDYAKEEFNSGDGAKVRDNSVFAMAVLCRKFGWDPAKVIKLHKEDPKTTHDCPGKKVIKADIIARVKAIMQTLGGGPAPAPSSRQMRILCTEFGGADDPQDSAYGGKVDGTQFEAALPAKLPASRRNIKVFYEGKSLVCRVNDLGPYNKTDAYWDRGTRPRAEEQFQSRTKAENGMVPVTPAALDLTPAAFDALGVPGKYGLRQARMDWEFTSIAPELNPPKPDIAPPVDDMADEPTPIPDPPDVEPVVPAPAKPRSWFWSKIGAVFTAIGGFLYDWKVALVVVGGLAVVAFLVWWFAGEKVKTLVNKWLDRAIKDA